MNWGLVVLALLVVSGVLVSPLTRTAFVASLRRAVRERIPALSPAAVDLVVAHAAFESGWGAAAPYKRGWNAWNLTAGSQWIGETWAQENADDEYRPDGSKVRISQVWRVYSSLESAVDDYWAFLGPTFNGGRYARARAALERADVERFVSELSRAGYFTLPTGEYSARLKGVLSSLGAA